MSYKVYIRFSYIADIGMKLRSSSASWHSVLPVPRQPLMAIRVVRRTENLTLRLTYEIASLQRIFLFLAKSVATCLWNLSASGAHSPCVEKTRGVKLHFSVLSTCLRYLFFFSSTCIQPPPSCFGRMVPLGRRF